MTIARILYVFVGILCGGLAYASMRYPSKMDDANFMGVIGFLGAGYCLWKLGESFTNTRWKNHNS